MDEKEICDIDDLQNIYIMLKTARRLYCFDQPNKTRKQSVITNLKSMYKDTIKQIDVD